MENEASSTFEPKDKSIVWVKFKETEGHLAFVIRKATVSDKEEFVERVRREFGPNETIKKDSLDHFMNNGRLFLVIEKEEINIVEACFMQEPSEENYRSLTQVPQSIAE